MIMPHRLVNALFCMMMAGAVALGLSGALLSESHAQSAGHGSVIDEVTGYRCFSPACDVVRLPNSKCICQKVNPLERNASRLLLSCYAMEGGRWVECPVGPRRN
jgi:hypothetical protein